MFHLMNQILWPVLPHHNTLIHSVQVSVWLSERNAIALDENWMEATNLQAKVVKHQSFEAEVLANRYRVGTLLEVRWPQPADSPSCSLVT